MRIANISAGLICLILTGCTSLRPISSKPPESAIVLSAPVTIREIVTTATFPAGEYHPLYEDDGGYYYQAPTKVVANDIFSYMYDGGLYVERGTNEPTKWYVIGQNGQKTLGRFKTIPPHQLIP